MQTRWIGLWVSLLISLCGLAPVVAHWFFIGQVPTVTVPMARELLSRPEGGSILVDVRTPEAFAAGHAVGAQSWPFRQIDAMAPGDPIPETIKGRKLLCICEVGISSALAVRKLRDLEAADAYSVRGGMQRWVAASPPPCVPALGQLQSASGTIEGPPFRSMARYEQWAAVIAAFGLKPLYMLVSLVLVWVLRHQTSPDLAGLRWAMIFFFLGEAFCAGNYLLFGEQSYLLEYLHSTGMVLAFAFTSYAAIEGLDRRVVHCSDPAKRCAALELCSPCGKHKDGTCKARQLFLLLIPMLVVLCIIPLLAPFQKTSYNVYILGTLYGYLHPVIYQFFEIRYCPILATILFTVSFVLLWRARNGPVPTSSRIVFAGGIGALAFGLFRLLFVGVYRDDLMWSVFWEELTELLYMAGVGGFLWIFRRRLLQTDRAAELQRADSLIPTPVGPA